MNLVVNQNFYYFKADINKVEYEDLTSFIQTITNKSLYNSDGYILKSDHNKINCLITDSEKDITFIKDVLSKIKSKEYYIECENSYQRLICHSIAKCLQIQSKTTTENEDYYFVCNNFEYKREDFESQPYVPKKLLEYFGHGCQCFSLPKRWEKHAYQDYEEDRHYHVVWSIKTGVEFNTEKNLKFTNNWKTKFTKSLNRK